MIKPLFLVLILITLSACVGSEKADVKAGGSASATGAYVWGQSKFPLKIKISDAFTNDTDVDAIKLGATQWETSTQNKRDFFEFQSSRPHEITDSSFSPNALNDSEMVVYRTTNWPWDRYVLAITQIWGIRYNEGTSSEFVDIIHADILMNYRDNTFSTTGSGGYDITTVLLHEFGHFLGLQHVSATPSSNKQMSVMFPSISWTDPGRRIPFQYDINSITDLYGIVLGLNGTGASASAIRQATEERYTPFDDGKEVIIQLELRTDGECVHKENGVIVHRHHSPHIK